MLLVSLTFLATAFYALMIYLIDQDDALLSSVCAIIATAFAGSVYSLL